LQYRAYLLLIITAAVWGSNAIAGKLAVGHISPFLLTSARWGISFVAAALFGYRHIMRDMPIIRRHILLVGGYGAIGFACFNASFYAAAKYTTALNIVIIQAGMPLVIFIVSFLVYRLKISGWQALGFTLTLVGVLVAVSNGSLATLVGMHFNRGDALMVLADIFYGGYCAMLRSKPSMHWLSFMAALSASAFLASLPFVAWEAWSGAMVLPGLRGGTIALYTAIGPGLIAQTAFIAGAELIGSNRAGLFINLVPVFGGVMSVLILREALHLYQAAAFLLVLGGIALAERRNWKT